MGSVLDDFAKRAADPFVGRQLGQVIVQRFMATGDRGNMYLGNMAQTKREVALRIINPSISGNEESISLILNNAQALRPVAHPNVVGLLDFGREQGCAWVAHEFVKGQPLTAYVRQQGKLEFDEATKLVRDIARGLDAGGGVVHGDLRPASVIMDLKGVPKIANFGLGRHPWEFPDSPVDYISPEQVEGKPPDVRSDLYSLGCIYYFLLTGEKPFEGATPDEVAQARLKGDPKPIEKLNPRAKAVLDRLMARDPEARFPTAREAAGAMDRAWFAKEDSPTPKGGTAVRMKAAPGPTISPTLWTPAPKVGPAYAWYAVTFALAMAAALIPGLPDGARYGILGAGAIPFGIMAWLIQRQKAKLRGWISLVFFAGAPVIAWLGASHAESAAAMASRLNSVALGTAIVLSVGLACLCDLERGWFLRSLLVLGTGLAFFATWDGGSLMPWILEETRVALPVMGGTAFAFFLVMVLLTKGEQGLFLRSMGFVSAMGTLVGAYLIGGEGNWRAPLTDFLSRASDQGTTAVLAVPAFLVGHLVLKSFR